MARRPPKSKVKRKSRAVTIVKSKTYGEHERAPRGTQSEVGVNAAMENHGLRMRAGNIPAKLIVDALNPYRTNFTGGQLWQRLVSHFAEQTKKGEEYSVDGIEYWDTNQQHATSRMIYPSFQMNINSQSSAFEVSLNYSFNDRFSKRLGKINGIQTTIIMLFPDFVRNEIITIPTVLPVKPIEDRSPYLFILNIPPSASSYIACLKAEACVNGVPVQWRGHIGRAMCLRASGMLQGQPKNSGDSPEKL